jgi:hypothetical protein
MLKKDIPTENQKSNPPPKPEKPTTTEKTLVDDENNNIETKINQLKNNDNIMVPSNAEVLLEKPDSVIEQTSGIDTEVLEKKPTISEKFINMFFSNNKNEPIANDEPPQEIVRDDIEETAPVKEDMVRDEVVPFVEEVDPIPQVDPTPPVDPIPHVQEHTSAEEQIDLLSVEKPLTTEIDVKLRKSNFFCCTM